MPLIKREAEARAEYIKRGCERDCASLMRMLNDDDPVTRRWTARDLVEFPASSGALIDRLKIEEDSSVREVIFTTLNKIADNTVVVALVDLLRSENVALRNETIAVLKQLPAQVAEVMDLLLRDSDSDIRIFTVKILESLKHAQVEKWLCAVIENDAHINVCATAVDLLGEVGSVNALGPLTRLKERFPAEPYIQFAANLAIKRIREG